MARRHFVTAARKSSGRPESAADRDAHKTAPVSSGSTVSPSKLQRRRMPSTRRSAGNSRSISRHPRAGHDIATVPRPLQRAQGVRFVPAVARQNVCAINSASINPPAPVLIASASCPVGVRSFSIRLAHRGEFLSFHFGCVGGQIAARAPRRFDLVFGMPKCRTRRSPA